MSSENKPGRWTKIQEQYMKDNYETMSIADMATQLEKNPITVKKYCVEKLGMTEESKMALTAKFDIQRSPIWAELKDQFSDKEMDIFLYHWQNLMVQFKHDVFSTERMQLIEVCRLEILIGRTMKKMKDIDVLLYESQKEVDREKNLGELRDLAKIAQLEMIIAQQRTSHPAMAKEYKELLERKQSLIKEIRGSREQRIKRIEEDKKSIQDWMAAVVDNEVYRKSLGIEMRKGQLALYKELERLSQYYNYEDSSCEQVITNMETLKEDNV
jgi:hypothetical protein